MKNRYDAESRLFKAQAGTKFHLSLFGDHIAKREGYKQLEGLDALRFYLVQKYRWLPSQVRDMSSDDLAFLFAEEMHGWTIPQEARPYSPRVE